MKKLHFSDGSQLRLPFKLNSIVQANSTSEIFSKGISSNGGEIVKIEGEKLPVYFDPNMIHMMQNT